MFSKQRRPNLLQKHAKHLFFYLFAGFGSALFFVLNQASIFKYAFDTFYPVSEGLLNPAYISAAVGASGAISGIVAAFAFLHPNTELMLMFIPVPIKAKYLVSAFFAYDLFAGISSSLKQVGIIDSSAIGGDGVAHFAHIGGAIFGLLLVIYWQKNRNSFY